MKNKIDSPILGMIGFIFFAILSFAILFMLFSCKKETTYSQLECYECTSILYTSTGVSKMVKIDTIKATLCDVSDEEIKIYQNKLTFSDPIHSINETTVCYLKWLDLNK
jgi:hypothetical protein